MKNSQQTVLDFFRRFPFLPLFISTFGSFEKEFAAIGIVLIAIETGRWGTNFSELSDLRNGQGKKAVDLYKAEKEKFKEELATLQIWERGQRRTLGTYGWFHKKPTVTFSEPPAKSLLVEFTCAASWKISHGFSDLAMEGYVVRGDTPDSFVPTEKFFELLLSRLRSRGFIPTLAKEG